MSVFVTIYSRFRFRQQMKENGFRIEKNKHRIQGIGENRQRNKEEDVNER